MYSRQQLSRLLTPQYSQHDARLIGKHAQPQPCHDGSAAACSLRGADCGGSMAPGNRCTPQVDVTSWLPPGHRQRQAAAMGAARLRHCPGVSLGSPLAGSKSLVSCMQVPTACRECDETGLLNPLTARSISRPCPDSTSAKLGQSRGRCVLLAG